uniref:Uncharacterized protein n=1 Tax=Streptomyces auratus AGR0001 TaxID=1160718 RepID=J1S2W9_9ACTN
MSDIALPEQGLDVDLRLSIRAVRLETSAKQVWLEEDGRVPYAKTGARVRPSSLMGLVRVIRPSCSSWRRRWVGTFAAVLSCGKPLSEG